MLIKISCGLLLCPLVVGSNPHQLQASQPTIKPIIIFSKLIKPKKIIYRKKKFIPWDKPNVSQVFTIINYEANKWGVSSYALADRIRCESTYKWYVKNGNHYGLGQFLPSTFKRGFSSIGTRKVIFNKIKIIKKRVRRENIWSDGTKTYENKWQVRQKILIRHKGLIPSHPAINHGWAQVRLVARAMAGKGAVSNGEWECR